MTRRSLYRMIAVFLLTASGFGMAAHARAEPTSAVVLMYHRFGETEYPSTSVDMDQFLAHVEELTNGGYEVLPLPEIVAALNTGTPLPDRAVAITVDDAYASVYEKAWPVLKEKGLPFTLFVATDPVDRGIEGYMTWDNIRELSDAGVTIGSQAVTHPHMPRMSSERNRTELTRSADILQEHLGARPTLFAYPYGEASLDVMGLAKEAGYVAGFGQHSGTANTTSALFYLPRFPINVHYGGVDRFKRLVNTMALPVSGLTPRDPLLPVQGTGNPPAFGFTVDGVTEGLDGLNCYHSDASSITQMEKLGNRVEVRFDSAFAPGRTRINCTMPTRNGRWRWFGMQYYVPPQ
ncbi:polysaccharide deacetylase family protein [Rhodospirillaceae bacterium KN72]|uniref:Chitooligosaccharide deacetylase n=1 Tax=Pacificispira spongiicola TaxID=2729598 RepID=A0A7Y0E0F3_9PROT|nr:polysaccharide deacetylase family protein [Pacificispira spongiicola]NMM44955.1 polysaccharide deacetylase family protein [Pacificispira spongiicola]